MKSRDEIKLLLDKALGKVRAPHAQAEYYFRHNLATRFGENAITQNIGGAEEYMTLSHLVPGLHATVEGWLRDRGFVGIDAMP